tara:strand:- start:8 stop:604 length:597 start_codon:yes stop_codon:yes gene_type:complete
MILHPFIPFFTEKVWQDFKFNDYFNAPLMLKNWDINSEEKFSNSHDKIDWLINLISSIRSTKVDLSIPPGSFIDISINELNIKKKNIINDNLNLFKRLGRVSNISNKQLDKNGVKIVVGKESLTLYFDQNIDLIAQKEKIFSKVNNLNQKIQIISNKLKNKSFLKNAPKLVVEKERKALIDYKIEHKKLNSILNSIKN